MSASLDSSFNEHWVREELWSSADYGGLGFQDGPATRALAAAAAELSVQTCAPQGASTDAFDDGRWLGDYCFAPILCSFPISLGTERIYLTPILHRRFQGQGVVVGGVSVDETYELENNQTAMLAKFRDESDVMGLWLDDIVAVPSELSGFVRASALVSSFVFLTSSLLGECIIEKGLEATKSNIQNLVAEMDRIWRWYAEGLATPLEDL